jgi:excisionase family DNA binding protein
MTPGATNDKRTAPPQNGSNPRLGCAGPQVSLLGIEDVAGWLGVETGFVRRLIAERRIPFVKIGKYVRFDPDEVTGWIDDLRVPPESRSSRPRDYREF